MKFSRPINREIDIDGNTFIVSFDDNGIDFRLKGKRRTAHADWKEVFNIAQGEQGATARDFLSVAGGESQQQGVDETERTEQVFDLRVTGTSEPQMTGTQEMTGAQAQPGRENQSTETESTSREELGRSVSAGEVGPES